MAKKTSKKSKAQSKEKKIKTVSATKKEKKQKQKQKQKQKIINFVSGNKNKLKELSDIFKENFKDIEIKQLDIDLPELQGLPEDIVKGKLKLALEKAKKLKGPILVEDTSLCFNGYGGLPGPYIKYFLKNIKPEGLYKMACVFDDHTAYAQSIYGLQKNVKEEPHLFIGRTPGEIVSPRGPNSFGWDPCFQPKNYKQTYAEMGEEEKNKISHRGRSTNAMIKWIKENPEILD
jgi:inosine triphosphate pyrophosphatase